MTIFFHQTADQIIYLQTHPTHQEDLLVLPNFEKGGGGVLVCVCVCVCVCLDSSNIQIKLVNVILKKRTMS